MSGQPVKTKADQAKFLDEYLENLALQVSLQEENEKANDVYKRTGQLPPTASMPDTRTVEEKLKDLETLKKGIIQDVSKSIDKTLATTLVDEIIKSKYNTDNSLLRFFAQRAPEFMKELERKYKYGLKDYNDIVSTVKFIEKAYVDTQDNLSSIKDIFGRKTNYVDRLSGIDKLQQLNNVVKNLEREILFGTSTENLLSDAQKNNLLSILDLMTKLPPTIEINKMFETVKKISYDPNLLPEYSKTIIEKFKIIYSILETYIPDFQFLQSIFYNISKLSKSLEPNKKSLIQKQLSLLYQELTKNSDIKDGLEELNSIVRYFDRNMNILLQSINYNLPSAPPMSGSQSPDSSTFSYPSGSQSPYQNPPGYFSPIGNPGNLSGLFSPDSGSQTPQIDNEEVKNDLLNQSFSSVYNWYLQKDTDAPPQFASDFQNMKYGTEKKKMFQNFLTSLTNSYSDFQNVKDQLVPSFVISILQGGRITGKGIRQPRIKKPFISRIDPNSGITPSPDFVPFGAYLINRKKIGEGIVSLKTGKGSNITGYPNKRVSTNLSNVIKKVIGGGVPSYEELSTLDEDEKIYLHNIAKKSNILDKLSIPTPSKDEIEKEIHQFEVYKGEIMAGNDNKDLIKKFKLLLLKLKNRGLIPKAQAEEILTDISSLGY